MRRLILRLSALATVLVLGIIAIAQAQRGTKDASPEGEPVSVGEMAAANKSAPATDSPDRLEAMTPRPFAAAGKVNPLRTPKPIDPPSAVQPAAATASAAPPAVPLTPAPGARSAVAAPLSEGAARTPSGKEAEQPKPLDPFGLRPQEPGKAELRAAEEPNRPLPAARPSDAPADAKSPAPLAVPLATDGPTLAAAVPNDRPGATAATPQTSIVASRAETPPPAPPWATPLATSEPAPARIASSSAAPLPADSEVRKTQPGSADRAGFGSPAARPAPSPSPAAEVGRDDAARAGEGTGRPGGRELEGVQSPQLALQKTAPAEVQVGKPATFVIRLKNTGQVAAQHVEVRDEVPRGARLLGTSPKAARGVRGELVWTFGVVKPDEEVTLEVQWMPTEEGEIGSVATVTFNANASARTVATRPQLIVKTAAPNRVLIGEPVPLQITVSNPGSGVAQKVVVEERIPPGLQHPAGPELEYEIGDLKPGETRQLDLRLTAAQAGPVTNILTARGDANLRAEDRVEIEVLAPQLNVSLEGPKRRYLEREATYVVSVSNSGTAPARRVELAAQLPAGLKFVSANNAGHYEEASRTIHWTLEELPSKETGSVQLTTVPIEIGEQKLRLRGTAEKGLSVEKEHPILIEGIAAILFQLADTSDPIEAGGQTTYEIRVVNQGSKEATNVRVTATLPADMRAIAVEPATRQMAEGNRVVFEPLQRLAPKAETTFRIRVQGLKPGDQRVRVQLLTDELKEPVTKEESTRVYSDE